MKVTIDICFLSLIKEVIRKEDLAEHWKAQHAKGFSNLYEKKVIHGWMFKKHDDEQVHRLVISTAAIQDVDHIIDVILEQNGYDITLEWFGPAWFDNIAEDEICYTFDDIVNKLESIENKAKQLAK